MADLKFEGNLSEINDKHLEFIKQTIEKQGFKAGKVVIEPLGKVGDNYMANVKRIKIEDDVSNCDLKMVVKVAPQNETLREHNKVAEIFRNEHIVYTKLLPKYTQLEELHDVPAEDRFKYPTCYGSNAEAPNEIIILEDLSESDFKILDRFKPMESDYVYSIIRNLAILHSLSFALKYKEPQVFDEIKNSLFDFYTDESNIGAFKGMLQIMQDNILNILQSDIHKNALKSASLTSSQEKLAEITKDDKQAKNFVIQHGDSWTTNFMFSVNNGAVSSILIDYQIAKASTPVYDLLFMITLCTDYESRKKHFYDWLDYYHNQLDKFLSNFGLKSNFIYSKDQFNADLKIFAKSVAAFTIIMSGILVLTPQEAVAVRKAMENADTEAMANLSGSGSEDPETMAAFKNKVEGILDSYLDFGLL